jgi:hypothetical protein
MGHNDIGSLDMDWDNIKLQLEQILNAPLRIEKLSEREWNKYKKTPAGSDEVKSVDHNHEVLFFLNKEVRTIYVLLVEAVLITHSERQLVEMMIEAYRTKGTKENTLKGTEEEKKVDDLKEWIHQQLENGVLNKELPESFASQSPLYSAKVPLLLYGDYSDSRKVGYQDLKKLLQSFFDDVDMILIPLLDKEWLILCSESLLESEDEDKGLGDNESKEDALESICLGLYEMMVSEGIGECHLSIHYPMIPAQSMLAAILHLREAISLGRTYHVGSNIHMPWNLHLERVLNLLPDTDKKKIAEYILKRNDYFMDSETQMTLEQFFALDCNVSETAKKLYIHRNTLLYRLDKFKQETNLDVRTFSDAVLVKISLLLYKVTKRK